MPMYEAQLSQLRKDVIDGAIDKRHDLDALQVALSALGGLSNFSVALCQTSGHDARGARSTRQSHSDKLARSNGRSPPETPDK